jgi:hypothetical protein
MVFPRYKYNDFQRLKDASVYLEKILNNDIIHIIRKYFVEKEKNEISLNYLNIEKRWRQLECFTYEQLKEQYLKIPSDKRIILHSSNQFICNKKLMIETISRYERVHIDFQPVKRTSSYSDLIHHKNYDIVKQFKTIWKYNDQQLSDMYMNISKSSRPALFYWPDITKHLDKKNANIIRSHLISSLVKNVKINKNMIKDLIHTI